MTVPTKREHPSFGIMPSTSRGVDALVRAILRDHPVRGGMSSPSKMYHVLMELHQVVRAGVPGHVVELGCFAGETAGQMRRLLDALGQAGRELHVYDSWEGVPEPAAQDVPEDPRIGGFTRGMCVCARVNFEQHFAREGLRLPHVHSGWFAQIPDEEYPCPIAFAFFDGDMYSSIVDSFAKVYPRLSRGARVVVDDYEWEPLPGVKRACQDFLRDKPESEQVIADYFGPGLGGGALVIKL
jgi:Macrocin-O-methyltransferase (TylF)